MLRCAALTRWGKRPGLGVVLGFDASSNTSPVCWETPPIRIGFATRAISTFAALWEIARPRIDQLGRMYRVNRATAAHWLEGVRKRVFESVRRQLQLAHGLTDREFESIARGVRSQLDISLSATLSEPLAEPSASSGTELPPRDPS